MSDYIKREDAIKQIVKGEEMYGEEFATDTGRVKDFLNVLTSADVVEVVRCKDCIYCKKGERLNMCIGLPLKTGYGFEMSVNDDDYCSFGKRKREE